MRKNAILLFVILGIILFSCSSHKEQIIDDSQYLSSTVHSIEKEKQSNDRDTAIKKIELKVELIDFCNSNVACGTMAFASVSKVRILDGKYQNDTIKVAELCGKIDYIRKKTYKLKYTPPPDFGVILCFGGIYNSDYNSNTENDYYITFGSLTEVTNMNESNK